MDIAVDASVIIAVVANESKKDKLVAYTTGMDLIAPLSIHWEIGNAFSAMLKQGRITLHQALQAIDSYQRIPVRFVDVELDEAMKLAAELNIHAYDGYILRCALKYNTPLLSLDTQLMRIAKTKGAQVVEVI